MRIRILSDLHLEFGPFEPPAAEADVVVLAGDIHTGTAGIEWAKAHFPSTPVLYVAGNHEFYGETFPRLVSQLREAASGTNVHVLERDWIEIGGVRFLGATLWTDFALDGDRRLGGRIAEAEMSDFRQIRHWPDYRRLRAADLEGDHASSRRLLATELAACAGQPVVVVTHHAPSRRSISPKFVGHPLNPAFASDLEGLLGAGSGLWIHGHIHSAVDYRLGGFRVINNPRGYPGEDVGAFDPGLVVQVSIA